MRNSRYKSRKGYPSCTPEEFCSFITDLRNFERFIPANEVNDLAITRETCSFSVSMLGTVTVSIASVNAPVSVSYLGNALQIDDFDINVTISATSVGKSEVMVFFEADLNPLLKMIASGPVERLLEQLVDEMEKIESWK